MTRTTRKNMTRGKQAGLTRTVRAGVALTAITVASAALLQAQFRSSDWVTSGFDAQRTAWVRTDARLTPAAVQKGEFKFLWQTKFDNDARQLNSLTEPVLQDLLIGYRGFKALAFVGGSNDRLFAIDTDLNKPYWTVNLNYTAATGGQPPSSWECPGGLMAAASRRVPLTQPPFNPAGGPGVGRGGRAASAVGEPGKGAAVLATMRPSAPPPPAAAAAAPAAGAKPSPTAPTPPPTPPAPAGPPRTGDAAAPVARPGSLTAPTPFGGVDPLVAVGADGMLRTLRVSDGAEIRPPAPFLPASTKPSTLLFVDGVVYTTTSNGCGATPNAVWSIDLAAPATDSNPNPERKVSSWQTGGADIAGSRGLALGTDGTVYVALGSAAALKPGDAGPASAANHANTVVALDRQGLKVKDWFTASAPFVTSPVVIRHNDKDVVAAATSDGKVYLLDSASLGGSDHKTPLASAAASAGGTNGGGAGASGASVNTALAAWDDGTSKWIAAPMGNHLVTFKIADAGGKPSLAQGWTKDLASPLAPIVVNGMVMAVSSGEYRGGDATLTAAARAKQSQPAVLYVLEGATGKEMWNSGKTITSFARAGLSAGGGQVYLVTYDNQLYAFGIPMEH